MKPIVVTVLLTLVTSGLACSVRPGFVAGGLIARPVTLRPECSPPNGIFARMTAEMAEEVALAEKRGIRTAVRWQEFFSAPPTSARTVMEQVGQGLTQARYHLMEQDRSADGRAHHLWYVTEDRRAQLIVSYVLSGNRLLVGFIGMRY